VYFVEEDFFAKANVKVMQAELKNIDLEKKLLHLKG
jgi:hypothetical protein